MLEKEKTEQLISRLGRLDKNIAVENPPFPSVADVEKLSQLIEYILFPGFFLCGEKEDISRSLNRLFDMLKSLICDLNKSNADSLVSGIILSLPDLKMRLIGDATAIYKGDPAARSISEIILSYPGFFATMVYRTAKLFYDREVPYVPRIMTERAHRLTGIDIHPGAVIGDSFCIDHGTGVVIGETARIGNRVKIYQGVTIGAKSFEPDGAGGLVKGKKRHPDIGDDCVIYAGATILGGDTVIGDGCVIGGNVWLTHSLPCDSTVYYNEK